MMILSTVINLALILIASVAADDEWYNDRFENMPKDVQEHFQTVLSERYSRLYWDMYQSCNGSIKPQAVIHLQIESGSNDAENRDKMVHWAIKQSPCLINVYTTKDDVLNNWCQEKPGRMLTFPYIQTKTDFWTNDPNFMVVVQAKCVRFKQEPEVPRLPLPSPFDIRQEQIKQFVIYFVPFSLLIIVLIFLFAHRIPFTNSVTTRWTNYLDRKEWQKIHDIIEYREQLINEENQKKMLEKYQIEKTMAEQTSVDME
uniref:Secreted protein n=2 Tax=Caenorhabditis tropicalis TaxID=1561998 RepID=A0A1I7UN49_9PELO